MKLRQFFLIILLNLLGLQFVFNQEKPKAILANELSSRFNDCMLNLSIYDLLIATKEEKSKALIVIYEDEKNPVRKFTIENWVNYYLKRSELPIENFSVAFASDQNKPNFVQFYKLPQNSELPPITIIPKDFKLPIAEKEYFVASSGGELFSILVQDNLFAKLLKNNPNFVGKIVVYEKNKKHRQQKIAEIFNELNRNQKIPRNQIQILYSKHDQEYPLESYSLVPNRRKS